MEHLARFVPYVNFGLLVLLAAVAWTATFYAHRKSAESPRQKALLVFLAFDYSYAAGFIWWFSVLRHPDPPFMFIQPFGQIAYWFVYASLIVAWLGYLTAMVDTKRITNRVRDES